MNSKILVTKGKLEGKVNLSGAKNCALRLLAASLLTEETIELTNSPNELLDMKIHVEMLKVLGKDIESSNDLIRISESNNIKSELKWDKRSIRNTLLILGALTTRTGFGKVPLPGGCKLGERKYDIHVMMLKAFGAKVWEEENYLCAEAKGRLKGTEIFLPLRSTGATENGILMGALAQGSTIIWNPHIRPEIIDLIKLLNSMGAKIEVFGQKCIVINGVDFLWGTRHKVVNDNMEALTWAIGAVITDGDVEIEDFPFDHLEVPLIHLRESGMKYFKGHDSLIIRGGESFPIDISTGPYPGINSDMQPLFAVYGAMCQGESKIIDLRFPGRYSYVKELGKMGLNYEIVGDFLKVHGGKQFHGSHVQALDLRAGIALVLAGLTATGETIIDDCWQIYRGYEFLDEKLERLGVKIKHI